MLLARVRLTDSEAAVLGWPWAGMAAANEPEAPDWNDVRALRGAFADVMRAVESLTGEVATLRAALRVPSARSRLLSLRAAARALGVSPTRTLPGLLRDKRIRTVMVNGRPKISMEEIERVGRAGTDPVFPPAATAMRSLRTRSAAPLARDLV